MTIKSVNSSQAETLRGILELMGADQFEADLTYGNGRFYKHIPKPRIRVDIDNSLKDLTHCVSSGATGFPSRSVESVIVDPPFLTRVRDGRESGMKMAKSFGGYWTYEELEEHYQATMKEAARILVPGGFLVFKCQDIIHDHRIRPIHATLIGWAPSYRLRLKDLFVLTNVGRFPFSNKRGKQRHSRICHSYFLVFVKGKR